MQHHRYPVSASSQVKDYRRILLCLFLVAGLWGGAAGATAAQDSSKADSAAEEVSLLRRPMPLTRWINRVRFVDLWRGVERGKTAFWREVQQGGFEAITGVEPRLPVRLLEGATYQIAADNSLTFILSDGTVVPPLSRAGFDAIRATLPPDAQALMDDKLFWHLQRNPAIPLIAAGLERGQYREYLSNRVFDTDSYYLKPFLGHLFWAADKVGVSVAEVLPLAEIHFLTLEYPYFRETDLAIATGSVRSFQQYELGLTNKQYVMRSLLQTPIEPWARLEAIRQVEAETTKKSYTDSETTSTTVALGRLPLPTPTAAEDTPGAHALSIAHLVHQGIDLFPADLEQAALAYEAEYKQRLAAEDALRQQIQAFARTHGHTLLPRIGYYYDESFWLKIGLSPHLSQQSVYQMDTGRLLGIFATRLEGLTKISAHESYPKAREHFLTFFQNNSPGLSQTDLLTLLLCDQALNPRLWRTLKRQNPHLASEVTAIQRQVATLETSIGTAMHHEAEVFRRLQQHNLDISTEAFSLLSAAMARRMSDLMAQQFNPGDRTHPNYLAFTRALYPFLRDMPDLNMQRGGLTAINRHGDNYVVPDLMALQPEAAPNLTALGNLWFQMVSNNDLNRWDVTRLLQLANTGYTLSSGQPPATLSAEHLSYLPLVEKYRPWLKQLAGADGLGAPTVMHALARQDFRIGSWPAERHAGALRINRINPAVMQELFPDQSPDQIRHLIWSLSSNTGELAIALPLVLLHRPVFTLRGEGAIDLVFEHNGTQVRFPAVNHHFEAVYSPAYMARIALPRTANQPYVDALNQVVRRTHALYGGYTPRDMTLPPPLYPLLFE